MESVVGRGVRRFGRAALVSADLNRPDFAAAAGLTMFGSVSSHPPATVVSVSVASLVGRSTEIQVSYSRSTVRRSGEELVCVSVLGPH
jgi:hypothetical protein